MSEFDIDSYETNDHGLLTKDSIIHAFKDNPAYSRYPTVVDSARYLYRDNETRWKFQEIYNVGKGDDEPDVSDIQNWKRTIEGHGIDESEYDSLEDGDNETQPEDHETPDVAEPDEKVYWAEVEETILLHFTKDTLKVCEALATVPIQLMFDDFTDCPMVIVVGNASSGKTTALELFKDWDRIYTTHEVTPAAFVSHNADQDDDLGSMDLLPKITDQVLWVPEMGAWFSGDDIEQYMRTLSGVADGSGYVKSTGTQGSHGYDGEPGEYQFGLMGATTPPSPRAWGEMGNAGARVLMHGMPNTEDDDEVRGQIYGKNNVPYHEKIEIVQEKIRNWLRTLYHEHDGSIEMEPEDADVDVAKATVKLAEIIAKGRGVSYATENEEGNLKGEVQIEDRKRVTQMLRFTARARAAMEGRTKVTTHDLQVCARVAFATMPEKRREMVRLLCNPRNGTNWTTAEVKNELDLGSKHTAKKRMQTVAHLGLAKYESEGTKVHGQSADVVRLTDEQLMWLFSKDTEDENPGPLSWPFDGE
jgi:hypothetical protein